MEVSVSNTNFCFGDGLLKLHAAGHFTTGGKVSDLFSSSNNTIFLLHDFIIDYLY